MGDQAKLKAEFQKILEAESDFFAKVKAFIEHHINADNVNEPVFMRQSLLDIIPMFNLTQGENNILIDLLCENGLLHNDSKTGILDKNETLANIYISIKGSSEYRQYVLSKWSFEEKQELRTQLSTFQIDIMSLLTRGPKFIRELINLGLPVDKIIACFQNCDMSGFNKTIFAVQYADNFPVPTEQDSPEYMELYKSELVQVTLPEVFRRIYMSLLFPVAEEPKGTFKGITFERDGAEYARVLQSIKASYAELTDKDKLKSLIASQLHSVFTSAEITIIMQEVLALVNSQPSDNNRIIAVGTKRAGEGLHGGHAEGIVLVDNLVIQVNRGARHFSQEAGIIVRKTTHPITAEEQDFFRKLSPSDEIPGSTLDQKIKGMGLETITVLEMKDQTVGNCTLATSKAFILAAYYVVIRKQLLSKGAQEGEILERQVGELAKYCYKEFTKELRLQKATSYLEAHKKSVYKDIDLKILARIIEWVGLEPNIRKIVEEDKLLDFFSPGELSKIASGAISKDNVELAKLILSKVPLIDNAMEAEFLTQAIRGNAVKVLEHLDFKHLNELVIYKTIHPLKYCILSGKEKSFNALISKILPTPYKEICEGIEFVLKYKEDVTKKEYKVLPGIQQMVAKRLLEDTKKDIIALIDVYKEKDVLIRELEKLQAEREEMFVGITSGLVDQTSILEKVKEEFEEVKKQASNTSQNKHR